MRILCVCLGNICRSPMAAGALAARAAAAGLAVEADSAGTRAWHEGNPADDRAVAVAGRRGYDLSAHRARKVTPADFDEFDLILAMDASNLEALERMRPPGARAALRLIHPAGRDVLDPFYGSEASFERALDMIEDALDVLLVGMIRDALPSP